MPLQSGFVAYGDIYPSVAVAHDRTSGHAFGVAPFTSSATALSSIPAGIAQEGTFLPALAGFVESKFAGKSPYALKVYQEGDICLAQISSTAGVVRGDLLGVDSAAGFLGNVADNFGNFPGGNATPDGSLTPVVVNTTYAGGTATTTANSKVYNRWVIAQALETANANELCRVVVTKILVPVVTTS